MDQASQTPGCAPAEAIHHELRTAENSAAYVLPQLQSMKETNPHLKLLDVGAGSGTISVTLAKLVPEGHVTAIDRNPDILPRARAIAATAGIQNIDFKQGNAFELPFADGTFDLTHCHQMLTHISHPWDALREMLRVTKAGSIVAAREGDLETECVWPELPGLFKFRKFASDMMTAAGGSSTAGRQLLSWALKAGVMREHVTVSYGTWSYSTMDERRAWATALSDRVRGGRLREAGLKSGLTTEADLQEMARDWDDWMERGDASVAMMHGEVLIQR